jgi:hypothetical protein
VAGQLNTIWVIIYLTQQTFEPIVRFMDTLKKLKTLQEAIVYFSNPDNCVAYLVSKRWKDGVVTCPNCGSKEVKYMASRRVWQCKTRHPKSQFSIKVGSVYEDSAIGLDKWLAATWMINNCKNGVSSYEIHRAIGVTQNVWSAAGLQGKSVGAIDKSAAMYSAFEWRTSLLAMMSSAACLSLQVGRSLGRPFSVSGWRHAVVTVLSSLLFLCRLRRVNSNPLMCCRYLHLTVHAAEMLGSGL